MADNWDKFLALVPPEKLRAAEATHKAEKDRAAAAAEQATRLESETSTQFEAEFAQHIARGEQLRTATPPPALGQLPPLQRYQEWRLHQSQWLQRCAAFDGAAAQLSASGKPAFAARLAFVKQDTQGVIHVIDNMIADAKATQQTMLSKQAEMNKEALDAALKRNEETKKFYDRLNSNWSRNR